MTRLDATKSITKRSFGRKNFFKVSNFVSTALSERYREMKKRGRKLMKYLEVIKWVTFNNLQNK
jgi:hypothetical protein